MKRKQYSVEQIVAAHLRFASAYIERLSLIDTIAHAPFYLDPPHFQVEGHGVPFPFAENTKR
ncbi:hypothetical protein [Burkholderia ubonensis]|uniref:hypothetical protein n=1 Tax=Burkholderia ubonensis TaxID=101571 RepID=UPI0007C8666E|nr:hypothetical protein [Burkholderia ubonensis]